jgi:hypothetical protein
MSLIQPTRRGFLRGMATLIAAPAIVRASSIMPVRVLDEEWSPSQIIRFRTGPISMTQMRELLLPGLREISMRYTGVQNRWPGVFLPDPADAA